MRSIVRMISMTALAGAVAWADDVKPAQDLRAASRWKAGETVTETETSETLTTITFSDPNGRPRVRNEGPVVQESVVVRRCLEADDDGTPTKMLLCVQKWGDARDSSLESAVLELSRDGWKLLTPDLELTPQARKWLVGDLLCPGTSGEVAAREYLPAETVAAGATWKLGQQGGLSRVLAKFGVKPDEKGVEGACTLVSAKATDDGTSIRVEHEASAASPEPQDAKAPLGRVSVREKGSVEGVPGAWHRTLATASKANIEFRMRREGSEFLFRSMTTLTTTHAPGGEIPSWAPKPPDEDATLCAFGRAPVAVGDTVTEDAEDDLKVTTRAEDCACAPCPTPEDSATTEWTLVRRCVAAEAGRSTKDRVFVKAWKHEEKGATDTSLTGVSFDVTADGWTPVTESKLSDAARKWIESRPAAGAEPDAPVAPRTPGDGRAGQVWMPDTATLAKAALWNDGFTLEPGHATGRARITEAEEAQGVVTAKVRFHTETPLAGTVGKGEKRVTALPGSEVKIEGTASGPVADWGRLGERTTDLTCSVLIARDGVIGRLATVRHVRLDVTAGGEMPGDAK